MNFFFSNMINSRNVQVKLFEIWLKKEFFAGEIKEAFNKERSFEMWFEKFIGFEHSNL
jgi:hypothetical protein